MHLFSRATWNGYITLGRPVHGVAARAVQSASVIIFLVLSTAVSLQAIKICRGLLLALLHFVAFFLFACVYVWLEQTYFVADDLLVWQPLWSTDLMCWITSKKMFHVVCTLHSWAQKIIRHCYLASRNHPKKYFNCDHVFIVHCYNKLPFMASYGTCVSVKYAACWLYDEK